MINQSIISPYLGEISIKETNKEITPNKNKRKLVTI